MENGSDTYIYPLALHKLHALGDIIVNATTDILDGEAGELPKGRRGFLELIFTKAQTQRDLLYQLPGILQAASSGDMLSRKGHDLRSPLSTIIGYSAMLLDGLDGELPETQQNLILTMYRHAEQLLRNLSHLVDYVRIQRRWHSFELETLNLYTMFDEVIDYTIGLRRGANPPSIHKQVVHDLPAIFADRTFTRQMIIEVIENAIKFTRDGYVMLGAYPAKNETEEPMVEICVVDSGLGISARESRLVGQPFWQYDAHVNGIGLGLYVARSLAVLQGGKLWFQSETGKGSNFYVTFPAVAD